MEDQNDIRSFTGFGEKLLADYNGSYRKSLKETFDRIIERLNEREDLGDEKTKASKHLMETGATILDKAAVDYGS